MILRQKEGKNSTDVIIIKRKIIKKIGNGKVLEDTGYGAVEGRGVCV